MQQHQFIEVHVGKKEKWTKGCRPETDFEYSDAILTLLTISNEDKKGLTLPDSIGDFECDISVRGK